MVKTLNALYRRLPPLHELDFSAGGFEWIDCHDAQQSVLCFERRARSGACVVVALNFTPAPRYGYRIGLPLCGAWREIFNSDSRFYGGSDCGNSGLIEATDLAWMGRAYSASVTLPPLAAIILYADAHGAQARGGSQ